jgi:hypothetical protein
MRATTIIRLAARAGMTIEVRADRGPGSNRRSRREFLNKEVAKISKKGIWVHTVSRIRRKIRPIDPMSGTSATIFGISVLLSLNFTHFREDSSWATEALPRRFRRYALMPTRRYDRLLWLRLCRAGSSCSNSVCARFFGTCCLSVWSCLNGSRANQLLRFLRQRLSPDLVTKMLHVRRYAESVASVNRMCLTKSVA